MTKRIEIRLSGALAQQLAEEAGKRELTPSQLLRLLIEAILDDSLIEAVLDDGPGPERQEPDQK